jgi:hypothetical protein
MIHKDYIVNFYNKLTPELSGVFFNQNFMIAYFLLKFRGLFVKKPKRKLILSPEDYEMGRRYALCQPHPFKKGKTLWDLCYDKYESINTIDNLNKFIFNEI